MVIVPCSMKTLAGVAHGLSRNLVERAADVMLKEQRRLVIVPRETPMSLPQLRNMVLCAEAGAMILPAMPAFYQMPKTLDDLADFMAGKILCALGFSHELYPKWKGRVGSSARDRAVPSPDKSPERIAAMFDAIAGRYDFLNHVLSAGLDTRWRARGPCESCASAPERASLDLCTGTADLAIATRDALPPRSRVVGVDFAGAMLRVGLEKLRGARARSPVTLVRGDATRDSRRATDGPTRRRSRSASATSIGPRRRSPSSRACSRPGGRLAILEFGEPRVPGVRGLYNWYFRAVLPRLGRLVSKHQSAYRYLPASVGTFPPPAEFAATISSHGFTDVAAVPLTFGVVYLYTATRQSSGCVHTTAPRGIRSVQRCYNVLSL